MALLELFAQRCTKTPIIVMQSIPMIFTLAILNRVVIPENAMAIAIIARIIMAIVMVDGTMAMDISMAVSAAVTAAHLDVHTGIKERGIICRLK